ncbi:MAG: aminopeptidase [Prevotellaceae bacterium]|nr:aminopeptidase [Prevotellaceae bacterium]
MKRFFIQKTLSAALLLLLTATPLLKAQITQQSADTTLQQPADTTLQQAVPTALQEKLAALPEITETKTLQSEEFTEKYLVYFTQPVDHTNPEAGTFRQRVIVSHVGFDRPTLIITEGYGGAYALNPRYREELSKMYDANMVFVEHRYFLESTPEPLDWQYLTARNAADDLHAVCQAFKTIYPGKWIATGISKGGQTTLLYRTFYPDDVDISVPYVAPLCYDVEDGRHEPFIATQAGTEEERAKVRAFQTEVLKRRATLEPMFEQACREKNLTFRAPTSEIYDYAVLEYSFSFWQWGTPVETIPPVETATDEEIFAHFMKISGADYFATDGADAPFFVQAARELGYYGYDTTPFQGLLTIDSAKGYLKRLMLPPELKDMPFDATLSRTIVSFLQENDPKMIFLYGQNDPWTAAGVTWLTGKANIHVFLQPRGSHRTRIHTMPEEMQQEIKAILDGWMAEP